MDADPRISPDASPVVVAAPAAAVNDGPGRKYFHAALAAALFLAGLLVLKRQADFQKLSAENGTYLWLSALGICWLYPFIWLARQRKGQILIRRTVWWTLFLAGVGFVFWWGFDLQNHTDGEQQPQWYANGWAFFGALILLWVYPFIVACQVFRTDYWPFIVGEVNPPEAEDDPTVKVIWQKWVGYKQRIYWGLMVVFSVALLCLTLEEMIPMGYALLLYCIGWLFADHVVEDDTDPEKDILPLLRKWGFVLTAVAVLVMMFGWKPLIVFNDIVRWFDDAIHPKFFVAMIILYVYVVSSEVLGVWLKGRMESDGTYLKNLSIMGEPTSAPVFLTEVDQKTKDFWVKLTGAQFLRIGDRVFSAIYGAPALARLFGMANKDVAPKTTGAENGSQTLAARPSDAQSPGSIQG